MARVHHCVVLARQFAAAALRACSHMAEGESAKRIEGEASPRRARQGRVRWTDGRLCRCGSRPLTVALWLDSQRKQRPASLRSEDHAEARMAQARFDSRIRARVNTFRALTYKLLVLAAEHVERSCRMSMRQGLQALFHTSSFNANPRAVGLMAVGAAQWSLWGATTSPLRHGPDHLDHRQVPSGAPQGRRYIVVSRAGRVRLMRPTVRVGLCQSR
jgi:hypothetical protein